MKLRALITFLTIITLLGFNKFESRKSTESENVVKIKKFKLSECLGNCDLNSRVIKQNLENNLYSLTIGAHLNCSGDFIYFEVKAKRDTLDFIWSIRPNKEGTIESSACNCFYNIEFFLTGVKEIPREILINGKTLKENFEQYADPIEEE